MTTRPIRNKHDLSQAIKLIESRNMPFTIAITAGLPRSIEQNKLQRKWILEAEEQGDQTSEEYRAYCKLHFGVPILRNEDESFREKYDRIIKPMDYVTKLELMADPFDFPVTRIMTTKQKTKYLDQVRMFFTSQGFILTVPES